MIPRSEAQIRQARTCAFAFQAAKPLTPSPKLKNFLQLFPTRSRDRQDNNEFSSEAEGRYPAGDGNLFI